MDNKPVILCVDDEKAILKSLRRSFFDKDVEIVMVGSGEEALEFLSSSHADMVVTDYMMPEMNGLELLREIKKKYPEILRVILSGYVEKDVILDSLIDFTSVTYFSKPWDEELLNKRLWDLLRLKMSIKNNNLWIKINNGFPVSGESAAGMDEEQKLVFGSSIKELKEFVKRDIFSYIRLLHLANTDYMKGKKVFQLDKLVEIPGYEYFADYIKNCPVYRQNAVKMMYHQVDMVLKSYSLLYNGITGQQEIPLLYDYSVIMNIENMILLSLSPGKFYQEIFPAGSGTGNFENLVKLVFRLWNIPGELLKFYLDFKCINIGSEDDLESNPDAAVLKILMNLSARVIFGNNPEEVPSWWSRDHALYAATINRLVKIRKSQL